MKEKTINFLKSGNFNLILKVILVLIFILAIFQTGVFVGYRKAEFSGRWGDNYSKTFGKPERGLPGIFEKGFVGGHGVTGKIIKISLPTVIVESEDMIEKIILIKDDTVIKQFRADITATDLKVDDALVVIGAPKDDGQIEAKLIRVLPSQAIIKK